MLKAVIFDWDGTLAENMRFHYLAFKEVLKKHENLSIMQRDIYLIEGRGARDIIKILVPKITRTKLAKLVEEKEKIYRELSKDIKILPEGRELILKLRRQKLKTGLVTGSTRRSFLSVVKNDKSLFDCIITSDETRRRKPSPAPYRKCLKILGVKPEEAVVVENAPLGIESAKKAGVKCIAIEATLPKKYLRSADFVVKNLKEAGKVISGLCSCGLR